VKSVAQAIMSIPINLKFCLAKTKQDGELFLKIVINLSFLYAFVCFMLFRHFRLIPNRAGNCGLFINKDSVDSEDFFIKLSTDIKTSDGSIVHIKWFAAKPNTFKVNEDWGWKDFMTTEDIFNVQKKYLAGDAITFNINVTLL
jgi:hypothetical protein